MNRPLLYNRLVSLAIHAVLIAGAFFMLFPFVWMVLGSLQSFNETTIGTLFPREPMWSNYYDVIIAMNGSRPCTFNWLSPLDILSGEKGCILVRYFANTILDRKSTRLNSNHH